MTPQGAGFKLGLFVVTGIALAVATVFALGAGAFLKKRQPLYCYFTESVKGLERDSAVTYRGVRVGRVVSVVPQTGAESRGTGQHPDIRVVCEVDPTLMGIEDVGMFTDGDTVATFVRKQVANGLRVQLAWGDLIGSKYLELDYLSGDDIAPPELGFAPLEPYVPTYTAPSLSDIQKGVYDAIRSISQVEYAEISHRLVTLLERLDRKAEQADMEGISRRANDTLDAANELLRHGAVGRSVERLDHITAELDSAATALNQLLSRASTSALFDDAAASAAALRRTTQHLDETLPATLERLDALVRHADEAVVASRLPDTTTSLRGAADEVGAAARNVSVLRDELAAALRDLSAAGRSITRLARALEERPDALLRGKPRSSEERP